jgi:hypothetical protein
VTLAHRIEAVLAEDGKLVLDHLPFRAGQAVEVIVLPANRPTPPGQSPRATVLRYEEPTEPVAEKRNRRRSELAILPRHWACHNVRAYRRLRNHGTFPPRTRCAQRSP